ncbi:MAG: hypothetical protein RL726_1640, partial [Actinomycetota bacterium]
MLRFLTRPKWILFHLLCLVGIITMILLSLWQFDRMTERRNFNDDVRARTSLPLVDIADIDIADIDTGDVDT